MEARRPASFQRILDAARQIVGRYGLDRASLADIAALAGVPPGVLRYHFRSKEHLLIEAWRATFKRIHEQFERRFSEGDRGVGTAMEALDALWASLRDMYGWAPFMVQTMAFATRDRALAERLADFNAEALARVELGLMRLFADELDRLVLPPDRLSRAVRTGLYGLIVELASARDDAERALVDQTYLDVRAMLERVVMDGHGWTTMPH
ncbi:MAG TPA: helix-turn-helix domain-containing protein [Myxococcota bacterium]|nr:helix-turn-helix domain-containing protein [Myxococcota bacterium]